MAKTVVFSAGLGGLIAMNWGRLEQPRPGVWPLALVVALGIAPALLPSRLWRAAAGALAFFAVAWIALELSRPYAIGALAEGAGRGFLDFYDVLVPFDAGAHPLMHGVLLIAVFAFSLLAALAVAARRPLAATLALVAGAGWPATILPGSGDLGRGALLLVASLALVAWLRPETRRRFPPQVLAGSALVVLALIVSSSGSIAKAEFLNWQSWDPYTRPGKAVSVEFVWRSDYSGIHFPQKRTRVLVVTAPERSTYWRATTLDSFTSDRWNEDLVTVEAFRVGDVDDLSNDPLLPERGRNPDRWTRARVRVDALRDFHLVGPSGPVAYETGLGYVQYAAGGIAFSASPLGRGAEYTAYGFEARPKPSQLARSRPDYPPEIFEGGHYLSVERGRQVPAFGSPDRATWLADAFRSYPELRRYAPLYRVAENIAGRARNPYAATVAIEAWLRSGGSFTYDETPPPTRGIAPLVAFVTGSKRGYCQHFAGAMALMLRYLGIPARVAAGFTSGVYDRDRGSWRVYDRNAHTWVEVWFRGYGWLPFDPTPGRGNLGGPYTASSISFDAPGAEKVLKQSALAAGELLRFELRRRGVRGRGDPVAAGGDTGKGRGGRSSGGGVSPTGIAVLAAFMLALVFVGGKLALRRSRYFTGDPRRLASACRRELVEYLLDQRVEVPASVSLEGLQELVRAQIGVDPRRLVDRVGLARFGPISEARPAAKEARAELRAVRRRFRAALSAQDRLRGLFSVRSLLSSL